MTSTVTLSRLTYSGPDGRTLFSNLDLSFGSGRTGLVGRNGVDKTTLFRLIAGDLTPLSGSVGVSGRIGVLRQQVQPAPDETIADLFGVRDGLSLLGRAMSGNADLEQLAEADWTLESRLDEALSALRLDVTPQTLLTHLSGGQRTRAALAALLFDSPDLVLLDEPTNNLDRDGRVSVADMLSRWRGTAIVISHDRELLETMDNIVELTGLGATVYDGNWSFYRERKALELASAQHDLDVAERQVRDAAKAAQVAKEKQDRREAGGRKKGAKGDMPKILAGGLKRSAEATAGNLNRLANKQADAAEIQAEAARAKIEVLAPFAVKLMPSGAPSGKVLLRANGVTGGHDPEKPAIRDFCMDIIGSERVAITGPNGVGKTSLLKLLTGGLDPLSGSVQIGGKMAVLDQQVALLERDETIVENFRRLNPESSVQDCRSVLAAFQFRNDAALQKVGTLSGGEMLRAGLACVLGGKAPPMLIILDEPTNHLDLSAIEVVEAGLRAFDGALLIVSHDRVFLYNIGVSREVLLEGDR